MNKEEIAARRRELESEEARLRRRLEELEDTVQLAPGSHNTGAPSSETMRAEREITGVVLKLYDIDRERQELSIAASLPG